MEIHRMCVEHGIDEVTRYELEAAAERHAIMYARAALELGLVFGAGLGMTGTVMAVLFLYYQGLI